MARSSGRCGRSGSRARCTARRCSTPSDRVLRPGDPVERRPQRAAVRHARAPRAPLARDHRQPRHARLHRAEAALGAEHEPDLFARVARVLLPKDWLRLRLTGEAVSEMSDAAGTLWLDVAARRWSPRDARGHRSRRARDARACRGLGAVRAAARRGRGRVGLSRGVMVAGGRGRQRGRRGRRGRDPPGDAFLSLGTSGVYFVAGRSLRAEPRARRPRLLPLPAGDVAPDVGQPQCRELSRLGHGRHRRHERGRAARGDRGPGPRSRRALPSLSLGRAHAARRSARARRLLRARRTTRRAPISAAPCSKAWPSRSPTGRRHCSRRALRSSASRSSAAARAAALGTHPRERARAPARLSRGRRGGARARRRAPRTPRRHGRARRRTCVRRPPLVRDGRAGSCAAAILAERLARWRRLYQDLRERFAEAG